MSDTVTGPSTAESPYVVPTQPNVRLVSLLSAGDTVAGSINNADGSPWRFVGIPDGLGALDNGDGTATVLVNHEIGETNGIVRDHNSIGSFVSRLTVDVATLKVVAAGDLADEMFLWDPAANDGAGGHVWMSDALGRLCSGDLAPISGTYDGVTGLGTTDRIYLTGEEVGAEGRGFGFVVTGDQVGQVFELPYLGKFSWENALMASDTGARTVVIATDDATPGQLYLYAGDKLAEGNPIEKAGLNNGELFGIRASFRTEANEGTPLSGDFTLAALGDRSAATGAALEIESDAAGVTEWLRPEDGQWDTLDPDRFLFTTTNSITGPSRLWALDFADRSRPELGGTFTALLDGTEGQRMLDNMTVAADGKVLLQEDVGNNPRLGKIWSYDPGTDTLTEIARHDAARFGSETQPAAPPFNMDEESSGIIDVTAIFGDADTQAFLLDTQAHHPFGEAGSLDRQEIVQGGQLMIMYVDQIA